MRSSGPAFAASTRWAAPLWCTILGIGVAVAAPDCLAASDGSLPDLGGVWELAPGQSALRPVDGGMPPFQAAAAKVYADRLAVDRAPGHGLAGLRSCVPNGVPELLYSPGPFQVLQTASVVLFVHEANHLPRFVYLDRSAPADLDPSHLGFSVGRWQGKALIIDTAGFTDKSGAGWRGMPYSDRLHVSERLTLEDRGRTLRDEMTIEDGKVFTRPWRAVARFRRQPGRRLGENLCALSLETQGRAR